MAVLVVAGAMVGAPLRFVVDRAMQARFGTAFPWGTLTVNIVGSAILGGLVGLHVNSPSMALLGVGFCGALTTYSTFGWETLRLIEQGAYVRAATNVCLSVGAGLLAAILGCAVAQWMTT